MGIADRQKLFGGSGVPLGLGAPPACSRVRWQEAGRAWNQGVLAPRKG